MATITHVTTPDGVTHNLGGGGSSITYNISLGAVSGNAVPIILTGSNNTTDTVYVKGGGDVTMSVSGDTMTITANSGQVITYTFTGSGNETTYTITATPSSGTAQTVTIPAATTTSAGLMTDADKTKLNGIETGAEVNVQSDWNQTDATADDYIKNKPTIPPGVTVDSALSTTSTNPVENRVITNALDDKVDKEAGKGLSTNDFTTAEKNKLAGIQAGAEQNVQSDWNEADSTSDAFILNKPTIPTKTSDLTNDSDFVSDASYVHTDNNFTTTLKDKLDGIESGAEVNVQSDWNQSDSTADDYIKNKPTITPQNIWYATSPTAANTTAKVATTTSGDFSLSEGNIVYVRFNHANAVSSITLNVDGTGAKDVYFTDNLDSMTYRWTTGEVVGLVYTGTKFITFDGGTATTTYYGITKLASSTSSTATNVAATPYAVKIAYDLADSKSVVSVTQKETTGVNIADITVDGTTTQLFAPQGEENVQADWNQSDSTADDYIKNKPTIPTVNDGTLTIQKNGSTIDTFTANQSSNTTVNVTVPTATSDLTNDSDFVSDASYVHTDNNFTTTLKNKLNGIQAGAEVNVQSDWNQSDSTADDFIKNKPTLATVATSGDYDDLSNKPTIPTVNDGTLTIQKNGATIDSFTANQSGNTTVNVTVPTATSEITNDSNFVSDASYVHTDNNFTTTLKNKLDGIASGAEVNVQSDWNVSDSTSDAFIKNKPSIPTATSDLTNDSNFVSDASYVHTDNNFTNADVTKLSGIESGAEVNVQADWNQADSTADDYIKNKPIIPPGSVIDPALDPTSSNAVANSAIVAALDTKVDKVTGKGLSEEDFTSTEKTKLSGIADGAEVNVQADWNEADSSSDAYIQNKPTIPSVSVDQITTTGTNIADITINGTTTNLYAPSGTVTGVTVNGTSVVSSGVAAIANSQFFTLGTNYIKFDNGLVIMWGSPQVPSGSFTANWSMPVSITSKDNCSIQLTPVTSGVTAFNVNYASSTLSRVNIGRTPNTAAHTFYILVVGKWK